jgi:putative transposase
MCRVLGVSPSGYYAWRKRGPSRREQRDGELLEMIRRVHTESRETYGAPRIHAELRAQGIRVGRKRVARLMRHAGLVGASRRRRNGTTRRDPEAESASDLVERDFSAQRPDELWVADITYIPTREK